MVFLQTNTGKTHTVTARGKAYRVITVPDDLFFGIEDSQCVWQQRKNEQRIPRKQYWTVFFALKLPEISQKLQPCSGKGKNRFDWQKLADYAL